MKILITGGAGFIGSHLLRAFLSKGDKVSVIDNLSTGRLENIQEFLDHPNFKFVEDTVTNEAAMRPLIERADHIYHMAAPVGVKRVMENPVLTILDNVNGIEILTRLTAEFGKKALIASTSEVYGKNLDFLDPTGVKKLSESDYRIEGPTTNHRWAYANTKALDEFLSLAYYKEKGTEFVISRLFNTVGPGQLSSYGMVIPNFVEKALKGENVQVYGSGKQKRSFMHVQDVVRALIGLMNEPKAVGKIFNVGNPIEITIRELAERIIEKCNSSSRVELVPYAKAYGPGFEDMNRRTADISFLKKTLDFEIEKDLNNILEDVIFHTKGRLEIK